MLMCCRSSFQLEVPRRVVNAASLLLIECKAAIRPSTFGNSSVMSRTESLNTAMFSNWVSTVVRSVSSL